MTSTSPLPMFIFHKSAKQKAHKFLEKHDFYNYLNIDRYLYQIELAIINSKNRYYPYQISLNLNSHQADSKQPTINYCLELGGTFLKIYKFQLSSNQVQIIKYRNIEFYQNKIYTPEILFGDLTGHLQQFTNQRNLSSLSEITLVLAFPLKPIKRQDSIDGKLLAFSKNHQQNGVVGMEIGKAWSEYLKKNLHHQININVINDSSANILATAYLPEPTINVIAGTGTNISIGSVDQIPLNENKKNKTQELAFNIVNLEFGRYNFFPKSKFDLILQSKSKEFPDYQTEKMFSGTWQNLLFNLIHQKLIQTKIIDPNQFPLNKFTDLSSAQLEKLFTKTSINHQFNILKYVWHELDRRGAYLSALTTAQLIKFSIPPIYQSVCLNWHGGIFKNSKLFRQEFQKYLRKFINKSNKIKVQYRYIEHPAPLAASFLKLEKNVNF